ncbi:hypothetical protein [Halostreptopolyspora alba]
MRKPRWRAHLPYAVVLALLLPPALGVPWWLEYEDMSDRGIIPPEATPVSGDTARLAGSEWEYVGAVTEDLEPTPGTREVAVVFRVTPEDEVASDRLYSRCAFRAVDDRGRTWDPTVPSQPVPDDVATASGTRCAAPSGFDPMPAGEETPLAVTFEVPEEVASDLRFEVEVATHDPEIDHDMSTEDALAELEEYAEGQRDEENGYDPDFEENPPEPEAVSFPYREPEGG